MSQPQRALSTDSTNDAIRKRVCKACDRCRLKKSKCDGSHPCTRCKADNAICVFGERKKSHDKVYPKGYVEMLEQQQERLVSALQEMYHRSRNGEPWPGMKLFEVNGQPLTHDILAGLGLLETKQDGSGETEQFEEDFEKMQSKLLASGAGYAHRRSSISSESDHSHPSPKKSTPHGTPAMTKQPVFSNPSSFTPSPSQSPVPRQRKSYPSTQQSLLHRAEPLSNDPQLFQPEWSGMTFGEPGAIIRSNYAMRTPRLEPTLDQANDLFASQWTDPYDMAMSMDYSQQFQFQNGLPDYASMSSTMAPMELDSDFKQFIHVST